MIKEIEVPKKPMEDHPVYDYSAIESLEEFRMMANSATLIFMVNKKEPGVKIIYGKEVLHAIAAQVIPPQGLRPLALAVDYETDQPEHLTAAVRTVKGFHEVDIE